MNDAISEDDDMLPEYDFSDAKPAPYAEYFRNAGGRMLDEDVRDAFPDSPSVNAALRVLLQAAKKVHAVAPEEMKKAS